MTQFLKLDVFVIFNTFDFPSGHCNQLQPFDRMQNQMAFIQIINDKAIINVVSNLQSFFRPITLTAKEPWWWFLKVVCTLIYKVDRLVRGFLGINSSNIIINETITDADFHRMNFFCTCLSWKVIVRLPSKYRDIFHHEGLKSAK